MNLKIDKMTLDDLYNIQEILYSDFDDFWTFATFKQELECENSYFLVAKSDSEIVGFAGFKIIIDEADIMNVVVNKNFRNQGIGSLLLNELINLADSLKIKQMTLEVNEKNLPAISLYHKCGFIDIGIRKNYYNDVDDAILMRQVGQS